MIPCGEARGLVFVSRRVGRRRPGDVTTFEIVTIGEDLTEVVVGGGGPLWLAVVGGDRRAAARPLLV